ncbi:phage minor head protein [Vibrio ruber]|uniref:phage head morphogenesis protein n=1 Tax=Vibrio ruber TaxID=184755 RepID=UPI0028930C08|nr:phage minor head protein [Vibrio ruber]WNJ96547.1 phage minor head protein [Vibrio ruber]
MADDNIPQEALDYLTSKQLKPGFDYRDVWKQEHNNAFTVAKMMHEDILADTRAIVEQALADGMTFKQFRDLLQPMLVKKGWWGVQMMNDPLTQETKLVQLGSDARIKTIYKTNMRTARAAGQWQRIERTQETHPYLIYELGPSREHRLEHKRWHNLMLPAGHEFWKTHFPPNGWGCKCRVRQVSEREARRLTAAGANTTAPEVKTRKLVNKRTGEVEHVPEGIDPGWDYNAGITKRQG